MKPDYKNWIPKGMLFSLIAGTMLSLALLLVFGVFGIAFVVCAKYTEWCVYAYRSFSYNGERKLSSITCPLVLRLTKVSLWKPC